MASASDLRADTAATRLRILRAAEALFSERGVDGVSLQEIGRAAGQRHRSAIRYHFTDRAGLLSAILDRHDSGVAEMRERLLDAIDTDGAERDLHRLAEAWVLPVASKAQDPDGGMHFVRISSELIGHPRLSRFYFSRGREQPVSRRFADLVTRAASSAPSGYQRPRTLSFLGFLFHSISDWSNATRHLAETTRRREWRALVQYLVTTTAALWAVEPWRGTGRA